MASRRMTHMVSFRVSQDEFEMLRAKSQAQGARSISAYARLTLARDPEATRQVMDHLQQIRSDVSRLTEMLSFSGTADATSDKPRPVSSSCARCTAGTSNA